MATKAKKGPTPTPEQLARWQGIADLWEAIAAGYLWNEGEQPAGERCSFTWQTEGQRKIAEKLGVSLVAVKLLDDELTSEDLDQWEALPATERAAILAALRRDAGEPGGKEG